MIGKSISFLECLKHNKPLCYECLHFHLCDGKPASGCNVISLTEFETTLNDKLCKLDSKFNEMNEKLKLKKNAFIQIIRKDPRVSRDEAILSLEKLIDDFNPIDPRKEPELENTFRTGICESFSNDNYNVVISNCQRSLQQDETTGSSYCFLNTPKIEKKSNSQMDT